MKRHYNHDVIIDQLSVRGKATHYREKTTRHMADRSRYRQRVIMTDKNYHLTGKKIDSLFPCIYIEREDVQRKGLFPSNQEKNRENCDLFFQKD